MKKLPFLAVVPATALGLGILATTSIAQQAGSATYPVASNPLAAELKSKLDTKSAKVGDTVTAKTLLPLTLNNGATVPKGSVLTGKISEVQSRSLGNGTASMTLLFDQIQPGKKGSPIAIHGLLVGVAPKPNLSDSGPSANDLPLGSTKGQASFSGKVGQSVDNMGQNGQTTLSGSSVRNVDLAPPDDKATPGELTSRKKDFKLDKGASLSVELTNK